MSGTTPTAFKYHHKRGQTLTLTGLVLPVLSSYPVLYYCINRACTCTCRIASSVTNREMSSRRDPAHLSWQSALQEDDGRKSDDNLCVQTNALLHMERNRYAGSEKLWITPYFGRFAGQCILFEVKRSSNTLVSVKVKSETTNDLHSRITHRLLTTLYSTVNSRCGQIHYLFEFFFCIFPWLWLLMGHNQVTSV